MEIEKIVVHNRGSINTEVAWFTHPCGRPKNEDAIFVRALEDALLLAVADGLGGLPAGEVASRIAVDTLQSTFEMRYATDMNFSGVKRLMNEAFHTAHRAIAENGRGTRRGMATTMVAAFVRDDLAIIGNTGDSRAYIVDKENIFRTIDHTPIEDLRLQGALDEDMAKTHPQRHSISHALGYSCRVDTYEKKLSNGSVLILCTDGLHANIEEGMLRHCIYRDSSEEIVSYLCERAFRTATDNISIIVHRSGRADKNRL